MPPLKATRTKTAKSRRGCRQCKIRRLKCDEQEPECNNCLRRGFQCPGYKQELRWSVKHECCYGIDSSSTSDACTPAEKATTKRTNSSDSTTGSVTGLTLPTDGADQPTAEVCTQDLIRREPNASAGNPFVPSVLPESNDSASQNWTDLHWPDDWSDVIQSGIYPAAPLVGSTVGHTTSPNSCQNDTPSDLELLQDQFVSSARLDAPIDLPTTLVEYWFSHVCPMWSTFDSEINYNRIIPLETVSTSEPVFYALQSMSAAYLADSMPQINSMVPTLISQATTAIKQRLSAWRNSPTIPSVNITIDLLFAVFAMGLSLHWTDASQLGDTLFHDAREALALWARNLTAVDAMVHAYFHQALTYWEMLLPLADGRSRHDRLDRKRLKYQLTLRQAMQFGAGNGLPDQLQLDNEPPAFQGSGPHSWCGVSSEVIDVFGQVLALCRSSRTRHRKGNTLTVAATSEALCDIGMAHDLQNELLAMSFDAVAPSNGNLQGIFLQTGDEKTPIMHLVHVAEAYRQASLLQLYLTFEDLEVKPSANQHMSLVTVVSKFTLPENTPRAQKVIFMALQLATILEQIPADSGSRCIQPVLLILAAAGLRLDANAKPKPSSTTAASEKAVVQRDADGQSGCDISTVSYASPHPRVVPLVSGMLLTEKGRLPSLDCPLMDSNMTRTTFEVSRARKFVKSRLRILQELLPPRPIQVALDLVNAIWAEYDGTRKGSHETHWLDVMSDTGLETLFG